jgi:hypothetical protein
MELSTTLAVPLAAFAGEWWCAGPPLLLPTPPPPLSAALRSNSFLLVVFLRPLPLMEKPPLKEEESMGLLEGLDLMMHREIKEMVKKWGKNTKNIVRKTFTRRVHGATAWKRST